MKTRDRNALFLVGFAAATALVYVAALRSEAPRWAADGGGARDPGAWSDAGSPEAAASARAASLDAVPAGALVVARIELAPLRASPLGARVLGDGREIPGLGAMQRVCGRDPLEHVRELVLAIPSEGPSGDFGLVATGALDDAALVDCASRAIEARGGRVEREQVGSFRVTRDASAPTGSGEIAVRPGGPLLVGAGAYLRAMIEAFEGRRPRERDVAARASLTARLGSGDAFATVVLGPDQRDAIAREIAQSSAPPPPVASLLSAGVAVRFGDIVTMTAVARCDAPEPCAALAERLRHARDARRADRALRRVGLAALLDELEIEARGAEIHASLRATADHVAAILAALAALGRQPPPPAPPATGAPR